MTLRYEKLEGRRTPPIVGVEQRIKMTTLRLLRVPREMLIGIAQIMLQPSAYVGLAFIVGAFINSWSLAILAMTGCISGMVVAWLRRFPVDERHQGLYGFNGGLVGLGIGYFYGGTWQSGVLVLIGGAFSSLVMYWMLRRSLRPLTFPFVITAWILIGFISVTDWVQPVASTSANGVRVEWFVAISRGFGQVLFQESVITGLVFVLAIGLRDWLEGLYASVGAGLGLLCAYVVGLPVVDMNLGLFGYNGVLCGILFAGRSVRDAMSALVAIMLSVVFVRTAHVVEIPALTFPFVLASWLVLWLRARIYVRE